jgi:hypothetical protein
MILQIVARAQDLPPDPRSGAGRNMVTSDEKN